MNLQNTKNNKDDAWWRNSESRAIYTTSNVTVFYIKVCSYVKLSLLELNLSLPLLLFSYCSDILTTQDNGLKRSGVDPEDPTPGGGGTTPEGSLTLVSNLLLVEVNIGLEILGKLTKLNITKYWA